MAEPDDDPFVNLLSETLAQIRVVLPTLEKLASDIQQLLALIGPNAR